MTEEQESKDLELHVAVCAERYKTLELRLERIEKIVWWCLATMLLALGGMAFEMMFFLITTKP